MSSLKQSYRQIALREVTPILRPMTTDGTAGGDPNNEVDGSITPVKFWVQPEGTEDWRISQFTMAVSGTGAETRTGYGTIVAGLTNGIDFFVEIDGVEQIVTVGAPLQNNQDLLRNGRDFGLFNFTGADDTIFVRDNLLDFSMGFVLRGSLNEKFGIIVNDDLTTLVQHQVFVKAGNLGPRVIT